MGNNENIAYFSMEIGIKPEFKTYSGGLGVLAGDTLKSGADIGFPMVGVTLLYKDGFIKQKIDEEGNQIEEKEQWNYLDNLEWMDITTTVEISGRDVTVGAWKYVIEGEKGEVPIIFLDTDIDGNHSEDRGITRRLYLGDQEYRLKQETVLGIAGLRIINQMDKKFKKYHMNEGHSSLLTLELLEQLNDKEEVRSKCVFTTHTPVAAGHDIFYQENVEKVLTSKLGILEETGFKQELNTTKLALEHSGTSNAVSKKHEEVSEEMFPEHDLRGITNGIHPSTWTYQKLEQLYDQKIEGWREEPQRLTRVEAITDKELWEAHKQAKTDLVQEINQRKGPGFENDKFTIGFARRATSYKRATLLFQDIQKLDKIGLNYPIQIVMAGIAHPDDTQGKEIIKQINSYANVLENVEVVYLENYNMEIAKKLVTGTDLWLNTPERGKEASGTSGMKAALNGIPQLSVLDGWWIEGHIEGITGWSIGEEYVEGEEQDDIDSKSIYKKLELIASLYYDERQEWLQIMKKSVSVNASYFNTHRMLKDYIYKAYQ